MKSYRPFAALMASLLAAGCAFSASPTSLQSSLQSSAVSSTSLEPAAASEDEMSALSQFSWDLFLKLHKEQTSDVASPLSAFFALGMAANGASGQTLEQMENMLHLDLEQINRLSQSALAANAKADQLKIANSAWLAQRMAESIADPYRQTLADDYQAECRTVPFDDATVDEVNAWVAEKTNHMIEKLVSSFEDPALVLINALAFDAKWLDPYQEEDLAPFTFHNADGSSAEIDLMTSQEDGFLENEEFEGFLRPYEDFAYDLAVLLPKEGKTLDEAIASLDGTSLRRMLTSPAEAIVHAAIPPFSIESEWNLNDSLQALGMTDAFDSAADFSAMTGSDNSLMISSVIQKAKIDVDAQGTKAGATTAVMVNESAMIVEIEEKTVTCDRPFLYMIVDAKDKVPVFIGTVENLKN